MEGRYEPAVLALINREAHYKALLRRDVEKFNQIMSDYAWAESREQSIWQYAWTKWAQRFTEFMSYLETFEVEERYGANMETIEEDYLWSRAIFEWTEKAIQGYRRFKASQCYGHRANRVCRSTIIGGQTITNYSVKTRNRYGNNANYEH